MIRVFYGDDRIRAKQEITKVLGSGYEVLDGPDIDLADLPSIFLGASLLADTRHILIRDFAANKPAFDKLPDYLHTPHEIILFESRLDKRSNTYKTLKDKLEFREFTLPKNPNSNLVFGIYRIAKTDGSRAITELSKIKTSEDPIMFTGLLISQAIKDYAAHPGAREKRILSALAATDLQMKSSATDPWLLVESFLVRLPSL